MSAERELRKIAEGREAEIFAWGEGRVLRLLRDREAGELNEWQAEAMEAARASGVRVPAVLGAETVAGRPGLVLERVEGPDVLTLLGRQPWKLFWAARLSGEIQAALHEVRPPTSLRPLKRAVAEMISGSSLVPERLRELARGKVEELPDGDRLCHGDFHPANIIVTRGGPVLIDWTNATRGDPEADVARTRLLVEIGEPPRGTAALVRLLALVGRRTLLSRYLHWYRRERPLDMERVAAWEPVALAQRLAEGITEERPKLLRLVGRLSGDSDGA